MEHDPNYTTPVITDYPFHLSGARLCTVRVYQRKVCITIRHQRTHGVQYREHMLDSKDRQHLMYLRNECARLAAVKYKHLQDKRLAETMAETLYHKSVYRYISTIPYSDSLF